MTNSMVFIKRKNGISYLNVLIMLVLTFGIGYLPPIGQITPLGMQVLGIFIGVLYGWITIDILWPGILGMVALGLTGFTTVTAAFSTGIGNQMVIMVLITVVFAGAMDECKITDLIANWFLTRKCVKGRPWVLISMIVFASAAIGMFASGMAGTFILWAMVLKLADLCGYEKGDRLITFIIGMICIISTSASNCIPFQPGAIMFASFYQQATGATIAFIPYIVFNVLMQFLIFVVLILLAKYVFKLDASKLIFPDDFYDNLKQQPVTKDQRIGLIAVTAFFLMLFLPGILPNTWPWVAILAKMGIIGVSSVLLIALAVLRTEAGEPFLNITKCHRDIPWSLIWLLAATFPLADAMKSPDCGIMATILTSIEPMLAGMAPTVFMIASVIVLGSLTQFAHNIVLGAMFIPFLLPICVSMGGNAATFYLLLFIALQTAYVTPAASAGGAMFHGHPWVKSKDGYLVGQP